MQKNPCSGLDVNPLHPSMTLQDYQDAVSLEDGLYPIEGDSDDYVPLDADSIGYKGTSIENVLKYSTTEHIVGEWIDGKTVYEKTVDCGALPNATNKSVSHGISNLNEIISISGIAIRSAGTIPIPWINGSTLSDSVTVDTSNTHIVLRTWGDKTSYTKSYVTLRYTKTS